MPSRKAEFVDKTILSDGFFPLILCKIRHTLFAGGLSRPFTREVMQRDPVAAVLPYDPVRDTVVLIEQFRIGKMLSGAREPWMIEIVAGIIENGETPEDMARREASEEANCDISGARTAPRLLPQLRRLLGVCPHVLRQGRQRGPRRHPRSRSRGRGYPRLGRTRGPSPWSGCLTTNSTTPSPLSRCNGWRSTVNVLRKQWT